MRRFVRVYRSPSKLDMYLYVDFKEDLKRVPEPLLARFGKPIEALSLELKAERKLARADTDTVLKAIEETGYYLQMPPGPQALSE
jgi:uncharacterized protein YcgL (UPF0745 family)